MQDPLSLPLPGREGEEVELLETHPANPKRLTSRSRERVRAIDVVFEADARERDLREVLAERRLRTAAQTALPERSAHLVELVAAHREEIDEQLSTHSRDWPLHRMPAVDRAILRTGAAEILHDTPADGVGPVIGEYATIARELSTEDSPRFVNGLLQRIGEMRDLLG
ncbi:transcription antitermination factor NusB [Brachybacterium subflavum]|uniref:transcription antitermination factor NusB n=1 Tax=Brachybacterium subflavum TaxID=2585206 RepID=UPI001D0CFD12|nr:transcription antitermination factor NusB [Brachybacterium subflavum]